MAVEEPRIINAFGEQAGDSIFDRWFTAHGWYQDFWWGLHDKGLFISIDPLKKDERGQLQPKEEQLQLAVLKAVEKFKQANPHDFHEKILQLRITRGNSDVPDAQLTKMMNDVISDRMPHLKEITGVTVQPVGTRLPEGVYLPTRNNFFQRREHDRAVRKEAIEALKSQVEGKKLINKYKKKLASEDFERAAEKRDEKSLSSEDQEGLDQYKKMEEDLNKRKEDLDNREEGLNAKEEELKKREEEIEKGFHPSN